MVAMGFGRRHFACVFVLVLCLVEVVCMVRGNIVFPVQHKFFGKGRVSMKELSAHDTHRHGRLLAALDFQLGGDGSPTSSALYFTKIKIGTPPNEYHVQVDTGSDILWVNCKNCDKCPTKTGLKIPLRQYDLSASSTGKTVTCDQDFCETVIRGQRRNCKAGMNCEYTVSYGDGSKTSGYFVKDEFTFDQVSGNLQTMNMNGSIAFGCSEKQSGESSTNQAVDGIIGFGQSNTSILSQLASSGKVKKVFSHCLDGNKGGGIFAIGDVVEPKVNRTPLIPNQAHYNVILKSVDVGGQLLNLPMDFFGIGDSRGAIIDSGTTLAYLPPDLYQQLMSKIMSKQSNLETHAVEEVFKCFWYSGNVNDGFPVVTFHFKGSLSLPVYPSEYLFQVRDKEYCIGWQSSTMQNKDGNELTLLGDLVLQDKVVLYDLDDMTIGWAQHNCSSSIKVKDEASGKAYDVVAHILASDASLARRVNIISFTVFVAAFLCLVQ